MASIIELPKSIHSDFAVPGYKPIGPVEVDWSNPITNGLTHALIFQSRVITNLVDGQIYTSNGDPEYHIGGDPDYRGKAEPAWHFDDSESLNQALLLDNGNVHNGDISIAANINWTGGTGIQSICSADSNHNSSRAFQFRMGGSNPQSLQFISFVGGGATTASASSTVEIRKDVTVGAVHSSTLASNNIRVFYEGELAATATDAGALDQDDAWLTAGGRNTRNNSVNITDSMNGHMFWLFIWGKRSITDNEMRQVHANPHQILKPVVPLFYFSTAGGGGDTDITASTEALTITTNSASIGFDVDVSSATEALTITEYQAAISFDTGIAANAESISLTAHSASIGFDVDVLASTEALTFTTNSASIGYSTGILANTESIVFTTYSPAIDFDVDVAANAEALSIATNPASIGYSTGILANTEALALTVFQASITFDVDVLASTEALAIATHAASISVGGAVDVLANTEALSVTTHAASIVTAEAFTFPVVDNFSGLWVTDPKDKIQFTMLDGTDKTAWSFVNEQIPHANPIQLDRFGNIPSIYIESGDCIMNLMNEFGVIKYSITRASNAWYVGGISSILPEVKSLNLTTYRARIQNNVDTYAEHLSLTTHAADVSV